MNKIAKFIKSLLSIFVIICISSCGDNEIQNNEQENPQPPTPEEEFIKVQATGTLGKSITRIQYEEQATGIDYKWEEADKITVCFKHEYDGIYNEWKEFTIESINNNIASFEGKFTQGEIINFPNEEWKYMWALSPAAPRLEESHWSTSVLCKADQQEITDGKNSLKTAYSTAKAEYVEGKVINFSFEPRMAILTFKILLPDQFNNSSIKNFQITGKGLYNTRVLNLEAPKEPYFEWKQGNEGSISLSFKGKLPIKDNALSVSVFTFPSDNVNPIELSISDGSNMTYH